MRGGKYLAEERGPQIKEEPAPEPVEILPALERFPLIQRLTDEEIVSMWEFKKRLPVATVAQ